MWLASTMTTTEWLFDGTAALLDTPNEDGLTERAYWHVAVDENGVQSEPFFETSDGVPEPYDPFERDQTYKED